MNLWIKMQFDFSLQQEKKWYKGMNKSNANYNLT